MWRNLLRAGWFCTLLLAALPAALHGQSSTAEFCEGLTIGADARQACLAAAQAAESAQPQLGMLLAGGNPTPGTAGASGLRLGVLPRVSAGIGLRAVNASIPDILADATGSSERNLPVPALFGTASVGVFSGLDLAPSLGGFGAVDLIGTATWLPLDIADVRGLRDETSDIAWGLGARVGLLRESFLTPGVSVSLMYRRLGTIGYGEVCSNAPPYSAQDPSAEACLEDGDTGEFSFDLTNWSTRATVGKRFLGLGLLGGIGYDRFDSDMALAFRTESLPGSDADVFYRISDISVDSGRWSVFANLSYTLLIATLSAEVGWMQGGSAIDGFPGTSEFDPNDGMLFGGASIRIGL